MRVLSLLALLTCTTALMGQTGTFTTFGKGCGGTANGTRLSAPTVPTIGKSFTVNVSVPAQPCCLPLVRWTSMMALGLSNKRWNAVPLPLSLGGGCSLLISPDVVVSKQHNGSCCPPRDSITASIPSANNLVGVSFYVQWLQIGRGNWFSQGGHGVIGR